MGQKRKQMVTAVHKLNMFQCDKKDKGIYCNPKTVYSLLSTCGCPCNFCFIVFPVFFHFQTTDGMLEVNLTPPPAFFSCFFLFCCCCCYAPPRLCVCKNVYIISFISLTAQIADIQEKGHIYI